MAEQKCLRLALPVEFGNSPSGNGTYLRQGVMDTLGLARRLGCNRYLKRAELYPCHKDSLLARVPPIWLANPSANLSAST